MPQNASKAVLSETVPATPWLGIDRSGCFFEDDAIRNLRVRATQYARAGVCVHFCGPAGLGKTSLALRVAEELDRPVSFMTGHNWLTSRDFIGGAIGSQTSTLVDRYVQSVRRTEKQERTDWGTSILAEAMRLGHTLIYDEFTRAAPEANATLLSVLEEGVLISTDPSNPTKHLHAHPDFRVLLTSNPHDYVAVKSAPDALLDRMVTLRMPEPHVDSLVGIVATRAGLGPDTARRIVTLVMQVQMATQAKGMSVLRSALMIARIAAASADPLTDAALTEVATDVLVGRGVETSADQIAAALTNLRAA